MNFKTNYQNQLLIATNPTAESETDKNYLELNYCYEFKSTLAYKKEDRNYFHNAGSTTSITTGKTLSYSVTIDFNDNDPLHLYLFKLASQNASAVNNQQIKIKLNTSWTKGKTLELFGKATFNFKNYLPSGNVDELQIMAFDLFVQDDNWTVNEVDTPPDEVPAVAKKEAEAGKSASEGVGDSSGVSAGDGDGASAGVSS